jgi:hypothetical protein
MSTFVASRSSTLYFQSGCRVSTKQSARSAAEPAVKGRNRARLRFVCPVYRRAADSWVSAFVSCTGSPRSTFDNMRWPACSKKLRFQYSDGFGCRFLGKHAREEGCSWRRQQSTAGAQVAPVGPAATSAEAAALREGFVEEDAGGFGHELSTDTTFAPGQRQASIKCFQFSYLTEEKTP